MKRFLIIISVFLAFVSIKSNAEESEHHKNHIAVLLGVTNGFYDEGKAHFTAGADYTYRFYATIPNIGLGLFAEVVTGDEIETIIGIPLSIFVTDKFKVFAAPSYLILPSKSEPTLSPKVNKIKNSKYPDLMTLEKTENVSEDTSTFFVRAGASYDFHFGKFSVSPSVSADVIYSKLNMLFAVSFGMSF